MLYILISSGCPNEDMAVVIKPIIIPLSTKPTRNHIMETARAIEDLGDRSPYLYETKKKDVYSLLLSKETYTEQKMKFSI